MKTLYALATVFIAVFVLFGILVVYELSRIGSEIERNTSVTEHIYNRIRDISLTFEWYRRDRQKRGKQ